VFFITAVSHCKNYENPLIKLRGLFFCPKNKELKDFIETLDQYKYGKLASANQAC